MSFGEIWCSNGTVCQVPSGRKGLRLAPTQTLWVSQLNSSDPKHSITVFNSMMVKEDASHKDTGSVVVDGDVRVKKKLCMGDICLDRETLKKLIETKR